MKTILVTGASGFIGKNLCLNLENVDNLRIIKYTLDNSLDELTSFVSEADFIFHLAGVNRPKEEKEFTVGNQQLTEDIINILRSIGKKTPLLVTSSTQAELDNPYGKSKLAAEKALLSWTKESGSPVYIYRLPGVFGKWCKPNYNSVVATFCHNIANNLPIKISDGKIPVTLVYIDNVVNKFIDHVEKQESNNKDYYSISPTFTISLSDLRDRIMNLHDSRKTLLLPNLEDDLNKYLYATYVSYLATDNFSYKLKVHADERGELAEFIKSYQFGQIFISRTKPGESRGNHWHNTKIEKFLVVEGAAEILFRNKIDQQDVIKYKVAGGESNVVDIPVGYVHSIKNTGDKDLITVFWANEVLNKKSPDTYYDKVE